MQPDRPPIAAIGNPYGGNQGPAVAPHGVVGSTGIGNGLKSGSNAGVVGKVASAGIPGATGTGPAGNYGKVGSAGIPAMAAAGCGHAEDRCRSSFHRSRSDLQAASAIHRRSPATEGSGRCGAACNVSGYGTGGSARSVCTDWAMGWMKKRAGWRNRFVSVRLRATAGRWT